MKLSAARIEAFIKSPDENVMAILVFGPEQGLIHERVERLMTAAVGVPADPFRLSTLSAQQIKSDPACLVDEAMSLTLMGGRRVVRVRDAADTHGDAFARLLELEHPSALVIADAGDLPKRSRLRRLFEGAANGVAIPCYQDTEATLKGVIEDTLAADGHRISREAVETLVSHLGSNRAVTRGELIKLSLYKGGPGEIELDDVLAVVSDSSAISLGGIAYMACSGEFRALDRALDTAFSEGLQPVSILRTVAQHLSRLLHANHSVHTGRSAKQAMLALKPPVMFRLENAFRDQMDVWSRDRLCYAVSLVTEAELQCKTTGTPARTVCSRTLMRIAQAARHGRGASQSRSR